MSRLIEVQQVEDCPTPLAVRVGDILLLRATGGRVRSGGRAVELWGPFLPAVVAGAGDVVAPVGSPSAVLVRARRPGSATLDLFTGDPWHEPRTTTLGLTVES
jgi:hypothetical protein